MHASILVDVLSCKSDLLLVIDMHVRTSPRYADGAVSVQCSTGELGEPGDRPGCIRIIGGNC